MLFGLFGKRSKPATEHPILDLDDKGFMEAVHRSVQESNPPSLAMWLVAYQNLRTYESLWLQAMKSDNSKEIPQTGDGFICWLARTADKQTDELGKRRVQWLFLAGLLNRASSIAQRTPTLLDYLAAIWVAMAQAGALLPKVYRENQLWEADEKEWFADLKDEHSGIDYVLNFMTPAAIRKHPIIRAFADEHNIFVSQSPGKLA